MEAPELELIIKSGKGISDDEVAQLYKLIPGEWVLLEPIEWNEKKRATSVKILKYNEDKEILRDYVMENDDLLSMGTLIYFFTGYDGNCKI